MPQDSRMPDMLTAEQLRELEDLEEHIGAVFRWALSVRNQERDKRAAELIRGGFGG